MMTPSEIVAQLAPGSPRREEALAALWALLGRITAGVSSLSESSEARELVRDRVFLKLVERSPLPVAGKSDGECYNYCRTSIIRAAADVRERQRREARTLAQARHEPTAAAAPVERAPPPPALGAQLDRVFEEYVRGIEDRYAPEQRRAWAQLKALFFGLATMDEVMARDEGIDPASSSDDVRRARNRLATNHKRVRRGVAQTARAMGDLGRLVPEEAEELERFVLAMVRCQRRVRAPSPTDRREPR